MKFGIMLKIVAILFMVGGIAIFAYSFVEANQDAQRQGELIDCYDKYSNIIQDQVCSYESNPKIYIMFGAVGMVLAFAMGSMMYSFGIDVDDWR